MRILLADGQVKERTMLRQLLTQDPELHLVGEATEACGLLAQVQALRPDFVLLDWELPGLQDTNLIPALHCLSCSPKVIVLSERQEACREAVEAGANAFVSKEEPVIWLLNTVRKVGRLSPCFV